MRPASPADRGTDYAPLLDGCLDSSRLFSLQPAVVLDETARLIAQIVPTARVRVLTADRGEPPGREGLTPAEEDLFRRAGRERSIVAGPGQIAAPLLAQSDEAERLVGVVLLTGAQEPLPDQAAALIGFVAARAATALHHALLLETQRQISHELQRMLLPHEAPVIDGLEFGVLFRSHTDGAEVGGDFMDFISLSSNQVVMTIADVTGHGIKVAATTVMVKYALRALIATLSWPTWPGEVLRDLHNALQGQLDPQTFVTALVGTIDVSRGTITLASAGHPAPFMLRADGTVERPLLLTAPAIALVDYSELDPYPTERIALQPGDTVLFHTDGIGELHDRRGGLYEDERMEAALAELAGLAPALLVERLLADALGFSATESTDDIALVAARLREPGA